ncbi:MAG: glycosyltransferase family 2 protein [Geminicoccales bacterium]
MSLSEKPYPSATHLVLIPSYNSGALLEETIAAARAVWSPVWVVIDGSDDGTTDVALGLAEADPGLRVMVLEQNQGKGAALLHGMIEAEAAGFTHVLTMDGDAQHPAERIPAFMAAATRSDLMVLGKPIFDASAPSIRVQGRKISNWFINLETLNAGIDDALFGFRVYPIEPLVSIMRNHRWMRRFDFDTEAVVRLAWSGVSPVNMEAPCRYIDRADGGVSHFRYGRDNFLLIGMHTRLVVEFLLRLPSLLWRGLQARTN